LGPAVGDVLPLAAAIALFPIPVLVVILMLFSPGGVANVVGFLLGWITGLAAVVVVAAALTTGVDEGADAAANETIGWVRVIIGLVLLAFALKKWFGRPDVNSDPELPGWMRTIDTFSPVKAVGAGLALTVLNPKNVALAVGAGTAVGAPGLSTKEATSVALIFLAVATLGVATPPGYYAIGGSRARATSTRHGSGSLQTTSS
jgi:hypothetical protein